MLQVYTGVAALLVHAMKPTVKMDSEVEHELSLALETALKKDAVEYSNNLKLGMCTSSAIVNNLTRIE